MMMMMMIYCSRLLACHLSNFWGECKEDLLSWFGPFTLYREAEKAAVVELRMSDLIEVLKMIR